MYTILNTPILEVDSGKQLGVVIDNNKNHGDTNMPVQRPPICLFSSSETKTIDLTSVRNTISWAKVIKA